MSILKKSRIALIATCVIAVLLVGGLVDTGLNWGKAYGGVRVGGIDVSGMTKEQISQSLQQAYQDRLANTTVIIYASEEARDQIDDDVAQAQDEALAEQLSIEDARETRQLWVADDESLLATLPADELADKALAAGREEGGIFARVMMLFSEYYIPLEVSCDETLLDMLLNEIDSTLGEVRVDYSVEVTDGVASVVEGHDGMMVNREEFSQKLASAFYLDDDPSFVAEVEYAPLRIDQEAAQAECDKINAAISPGLELEYLGTQWTVSASEIGGSVVSDVVGSDQQGWHLETSLDESVAKPLIILQALEHSGSKVSRISFSYDDAGEVVVDTDGSTQIPLGAEAVEALNAVLFGGQSSVDVHHDEEVDAASGVTHAERTEEGSPVKASLVASSAATRLTLDEALGAGIISDFSSYTTEYSSGTGTENRNHNIHLAADLLDGSIVTPDGTWSFNEIAGDCNEEQGFLGAGAIVNNEYTDDVGGGICQVATTVFNAVYEAGLPVDQRTNHSLYIGSYPTGRDAAISYPYLDLKWSNDTGSDILLRMSYTDSSITATLYGVSPNYTVDTEVGMWEEGEEHKTRTEVDENLSPGVEYVKTAGTDGRKISIVRTVTDSDGNLVRQDRFDSVYDPITEVIVKGPDSGTESSE